MENLKDPSEDKRVVGFLVKLDPEYPCNPFGVASAISMTVGVQLVSYVYDGDDLSKEFIMDECISAVPDVTEQRISDMEGRNP